MHVSTSSRSHTVYRVMTRNNTHTSAIPVLSASSLYTGDFTKGETHSGSHLTKRQGDPRSAWWRRPFWVGAVHPLAWISGCRDKKPQAWEKACAKHRLHIWYYYILLSEEKSIKGYHGVFDWRDSPYREIVIFYIVPHVDPGAIGEYSDVFGLSTAINQVWWWSLGWKPL